MTTPPTARDEVTVVLPTAPRYLKHVRVVLRSVLADVPFDDDAASRFVLAVDEACSNRMKHCQEAAHRPLTVRVTADPGDVEVRIAPFCTTESSTRIKGRDLKDVRPGGLGTHLMSVGADDVRYEKGDDGFMDIVLVKRRPAP